MTAPVRFAIIMALSLAVGLVGYLVPSGVQEKVTGFGTTQPRLAKFGPVAGLVVVLGAYVAMFSTLSILRHAAFGTHAFDLGVYDQVIWNSTQSRLFEFSLSEQPIAADTLNYLGFHFSPGLLLLVPIYWLFPDPRALLVVQTMAIASAAIPIYMIAVDTLGRRGAALGLAVAYLLSPATGYINLFDFHSIAIAMPMIAWAVFFMRRGRYLWWGIMMGIAMSFKESVAIITFAMGLYILMKQKQRLLGSITALVGILWAYLVVDAIIPLFRGEEYYYLSQYAYLAGDIGHTTRSLLVDPLRSFELFVRSGRLEFALHLLVPLGLTPLLGPATLLITLPILAYLIASNDPAKYSIIFHYSAPIMALIFAAAADGVKRLESYLRQIAGVKTSRGRPALLAIMCFVMAASALSYYFHGPGLFGKGFLPANYQPLQGSSPVFKALSMIPADASVSAHRDIVPHLTHRRYVYMFPEVHDAEFLLLWEGKKGGSSPEDLPEWKQDVVAALTDPSYEVLLREDGFILMRRNVPTKPTSASFLRRGLP